MSALKPRLNDLDPLLESELNDDTPFYTQDTVRTKDTQLPFSTLKRKLEDFFLSPGDKNRNAIINGNFDIWQRETSEPPSDTIRYLADRWLGGGVNSTIDQYTGYFDPLINQEFIGSPLKYFTGVVSSVTGIANYSRLAQRISSVLTFSGEAVTIQFWARSGSGTKAMALSFYQNLGSGGGADVQTAISKVSLTTSWQKFTINTTVPSVYNLDVNQLDDWLGLLFWFDAGSNFNSLTGTLGHQSGEFHITNVQMCQGTWTSLPEHKLPYEQTLALCQFYFRSFKATISTIYQHVGHALGNKIFFKTDFVMRELPTITEVGTQQARISGGTSDIAIGTWDGYISSDNSVTLRVETPSTNNVFYALKQSSTVYITLDAEL